MKTEERIKLASEAFNNNYNCAQAVLMGFPDLQGAGHVSVVRQSVGFGGGMGRLQEMCGALTGGIMLVGLYMGKDIPDNENKEYVYQQVQDFAEQFRANWGTIKCSDLLGVDLRTEKGRQLHDYLLQKDKICHKCVALAVEIADKMITEHRGKP